MVSLKTTIFTKLHLVVDFCVFNSQVMYCMHKQWIFFIKLLKSSRSHDFLKQIELDDTVDSMKNVQELHSAEHDK